MEMQPGRSCPPGRHRARHRRPRVHCCPTVGSRSVSVGTQGSAGGPAQAELTGPCSSKSRARTGFTYTRPGRTRGPRDPLRLWHVASLRAHAWWQQCCPCSRPPQRPCPPQRSRACACVQAFCSPLLRAQSAVRGVRGSRLRLRGHQASLPGQSG